VSNFLDFIGVGREGAALPSLAATIYGGVYWLSREDFILPSGKHVQKRRQNGHRVLKILLLSR
jgi:hypothetical protein